MLTATSARNLRTCWKPRRLPRAARNHTDAKKAVDTLFPDEEIRKPKTTKSSARLAANSGKSNSTNPTSTPPPPNPAKSPAAPLIPIFDYKRAITENSIFAHNWYGYLPLFSLQQQADVISGKCAPKLATNALNPSEAARLINADETFPDRTILARIWNSNGPTALRATKLFVAVYSRYFDGLVRPLTLWLSLKSFLRTFAARFPGDSRLKSTAFKSKSEIIRAITEEILSVARAEQLGKTLAPHAFFSGKSVPHSVRFGSGRSRIVAITLPKPESITRAQYQLAIRSAAHVTPLLLFAGPASVAALPVAPILPVLFPKWTPPTTYPSFIHRIVTRTRDARFAAVKKNRSASILGHVRRIVYSSSSGLNLQSVAPVILQAVRLAASETALSADPEARFLRERLLAALQLKWEYIPGMFYPSSRAGQLVGRWAGQIRADDFLISKYGGVWAMDREELVESCLKRGISVLRDDTEADRMPGRAAKQEYVGLYDRESGVMTDNAMRVKLLVFAANFSVAGEGLVGLSNFTAGDVWELLKEVVEKYSTVDLPRDAEGKIVKDFTWEPYRELAAGIRNYGAGLGVSDVEKLIADRESEVGN